MYSNYKLNRLVVLVFITSLCSVKSFGQVNQKGYQITRTGIQYKVIGRNNRNEKVEINDRVFLSYRSKLLDGTIIDEATDFSFIVGQNEGIKGWDEALPIFYKGDSIDLIIPSNLAYGNRKVGKVPPNAIINTTIKIKDIKKAYFDFEKGELIILSNGLKKFLIAKGHDSLKLFNYVVLAFTGYLITNEGNRRIFEYTSNEFNKAYFQLGVGKFIKGLDDGIKTMRVGEKATFIISPELAYGSKQNGVIPPNSTLYFDIEIIQQNNPFHVIKQDEMNCLSNRVRYIKNRNNCQVINYDDKIVKFHCVSYFFNENGAPKIFSNTHEGQNTPIQMRIGSKHNIAGLASALRYFQIGDTGLIISPKGLDYGNSFNNYELKNKTIFHQIEILEINDYPYFETVGKDTILKHSGLKYIEIRKFNSDTIDTNDQVTIGYTGFYIDSLRQKHIFDASRESGQLLIVNLKKEHVIKGIKEALIGMGTGDCRRLIIPPSLAFGIDGSKAASIPKNQILIFDIEIMNVQKVN